MELQSIVQNFIQKAAPKYEAAEDETNPALNWPIPEGLWERRMLTLNRPARAEALRKTILLAHTEHLSRLENIFLWSANVKGNLLDPASADLYLFIIYEGPQLELDVCLQVEADELYCRKYMLRPAEGLDGLLNRSFLCEPALVSVRQQRTDPLRKALLETAGEYTWMDAAEMERWRQALLTETGGYEIAQILCQSPENDD